MGKRIYEETDNFDRAKIYGKQITQRVAESLNRSPRTIEYAIIFYKRFNDLALLPEGKNTSWRSVIRKHLTGPTDDELTKIESASLPVNIDLINDDFRYTQIESKSIDLILTDPPYGREYLSLWDDLGLFGHKVLRPGGYLVAYSGHQYLPEVLNLLSKHLKYIWVCCLMLPGVNTQVWSRKISSGWKPILVFCKPPYSRSYTFHKDVVVSPIKEKEFHEWQQSEGGAKEFIRSFSKKGDFIIDPLSGTGTFTKVAYEMGRNAIGIEIDKTTHLKAKKRILSFVEHVQKESCSKDTESTKKIPNKNSETSILNVDGGQSG